MKMQEVLHQVDALRIKFGIGISYDIINQVENGYGDQVVDGEQEQFTITFYITDLYTGYQVDMKPESRLSLGFRWAINRAALYIKEGRKGDTDVQEED